MPDTRLRCLYPHNGADLLAGVLRVPFIDDIAEGGKLVISLCAVHAIVYGDKVDVMLGNMIPVYIPTCK